MWMYGLMDLSNKSRLRTVKTYILCDRNTATRRVDQPLRVSRGLTSTLSLPIQRNKVMLNRYGQQADVEARGQP